MMVYHGCCQLQGLQMQEPQTKSRYLIAVTVLLVLLLVPGLLFFAYRQLIEQSSQQRAVPQAMVIPSVSVANVLVRGANGLRSHLPIVPPGHWQVIYMTHGSCKQRCLVKLKQLENMLIALNMAYADVSTWVLTSHNTQSLKSLPKSLNHAVITQQQLLPFKQAALTKPKVTENQDQVFLVDSQQNIIMAYSANAVPRIVFKDLQHLIGVRNIG